MFVFGLQVYNLDRGLSTNLSRHYILYSLALGAGLIIFSLPALLTGDQAVLKGFYIVGEGLIDFSLVYQAWIAAHFLIGSALAKRIATATTGVLAAFLWAMQIISPLPFRLDNSIVWEMNTAGHIAITTILTIRLSQMLRSTMRMPRTIQPAISLAYRARSRSALVSDSDATAGVAVDNPGGVAVSNE